MAVNQGRKERLDRGIKVRAEGVYAIASWSEAMYLISPRLLLILGMFVVPLFMPSAYHQRIICLLFIYGLLAISFDFMTNFVGLVCLGGAMFMGVGGYIAGSLNAALGLSPIFTIIIATFGGAVVCTILLFPCLPLRGIYFAIVTLIYPLLLGRVVEATGILGGTEGLTGLATYPSPYVDLYLVIVVAAIVLFGSSTPTVWGYPSHINLYKDLPCQPCVDDQPSTCPEYRCMLQISTDEVINAARNLL